MHLFKTPHDIRSEYYTIAAMLEMERQRKLGIPQTNWQLVGRAVSEADAYLEANPEAIARHLRLAEAVPYGLGVDP